MSLSKPNGVLKKVGDKFLPPNFGDEDRKEKDPIRVSIKGKRRPKKT